MTSLPTYFDMVMVYATESSGLGPFTLGSSIIGFQSAASAGITNGTVVSYRASNGTNWEMAHGTVNVSGGIYTLTRGEDTITSSNSNSLVEFGSGVTVVITPTSQDLNTFLSFEATQALTATQQANALSNLGLTNNVLTGGNVIRNAGFNVAQRGTSGTTTTSGAYTLDGWIVLPTGANVTWAQLATPTAMGAANASLFSANMMRVTGASSNTDTLIRQRIESAIAAPLALKTVTIRFAIYPTVGITPTLSVGHPSSVDTYSSVGAASLTNEVNAVSLGSCPANTLTICSYTFNVSANAGNGLEINIDFGALGNGVIAQFTDFDMRVTPNVSTGISSSPQQPRLLPLPLDTLFCQRYYLKIGGTTAEEILVAGYNLAGNGTANTLVYPTPMFKKPTATQAGTWTNSNCTANIVTGLTAVTINIVATTTGAMYTFTPATASLTLSCEL